ncbi:hypothetical protein H6P81_001331 [Aristolochia fimbriata]|uniref:Lysosomal Pro-X carboxypeptidase n=1 Tax=Aristolochia fimbriata TaxID=158543 RepID=A0AAV7F769_ARIFI|nr:hypothetical protein H6P81_001331 [Aristolochia fimbriata]
MAPSPSLRRIKSQYFYLPQWLLLLIIATWRPASAHPPRLGVVHKKSFTNSRALLDHEYLIRTGNSSNFQTLHYNQTLDHFNYKPGSHNTFQQRYVINSAFWGGPQNGSPIFVYTGDEAGLDDDIDAAGIMVDNAPRFKALLVYIEHRYYGTSVPFGTKEEAYRNTSTLGYFSSAQALADYAELILHLKKNLSAESCPVVVIGGSYGGMLAAWFRLKYPHIAIGALASSAPILYFDDIIPSNGYYSVVTSDFREASESCHNTIRKSWFEIDRIVAQKKGLANLSKRFKSCKPLNQSTDLKDYLEAFYLAWAQYDDPPEYPVNVICKAIDGAKPGSDVLDRIFAGLVSMQGNKSCYDIGGSGGEDDVLNGWFWQMCTEIVMPIGRGENETMFQAAPFDMKEYTDWCHELYKNVEPRPHWVTAEYGGHNINMVLQKFGSNIIFSNGLRDPYSVGGVLQNISDSIVAISTTKGSHCLDLRGAREDDPDWLKSQRDAEMNIIEGWLQCYKANTATGSMQH